MAQRRRLAEIQLTGARGVIRRLLLGAIAACAVVGAIGYVLPAHRLGDAGTYHTNYDDGGGASLIVFGVVFASWLAIRNRRHGAGYLAGVISSVGAILAVLPVLLVHLFSTVEHAIGEHLYASGVLGLFFLGLVTLVAEPVLYFGQRRQLERDVDPQFPSARVV